ncbi:MAG: hypothetical protein LAQ30_19740 [Acidobacteriia bacterium]|nr:hypothetical protein [Terriglobia bacterium]
MNRMERDEHEMVCPRCGLDAEWRFVDEEKRRVEIVCPNCGRYEMAREEFDPVEIENQ